MEGNYCNLRNEEHFKLKFKRTDCPEKRKKSHESHESLKNNRHEDRDTKTRRKLSKISEENGSSDRKKHRVKSESSNEVKMEKQCVELYKGFINEQDFKNYRQRKIEKRNECKQKHLPEEDGEKVIARRDKGAGPADGIGVNFLPKKQHRKTSKKETFTLERQESEILPSLSIDDEVSYMEYKKMYVKEPKQLKIVPKEVRIEPKEVPGKIPDKPILDTPFKFGEYKPVTCALEEVPKPKPVRKSNETLKDIVDVVSKASTEVLVNKSCSKFPETVRNVRKNGMKKRSVVVAVSKVVKAPSARFSPGKNCLQDIMFEKEKQRILFRSCPPANNSTTEVENKFVATKELEKIEEKREECLESKKEEHIILQQENQELLREENVLELAKQEPIQTEVVLSLESEELTQTQEEKQETLTDLKVLQLKETIKEQISREDCSNSVIDPGLPNKEQALLELPDLMKKLLMLMECVKNLQRMDETCQFAKQEEKTCNCSEKVLSAFSKIQENLENLRKEKDEAPKTYRNESTETLSEIGCQIDLNKLKTKKFTCQTFTMNSKYNRYVVSSKYPGNVSSCTLDSSTRARKKFSLENYDFDYDSSLNVSANASAEDIGVASERAIKILSSHSRKRREMFGALFKKNISQVKLTDSMCKYLDVSQSSSNQRCDENSNQSDVKEDEQPEETPSDEAVKKQRGNKRFFKKLFRRKTPD